MRRHQGSLGWARE